MNAWLRIIGALAAIVLGVLLLKVLPPVVVLVVIFGGFWYGAHRLRRSERSERRAGAEILGLRRETSDPFGLLAYPLELFTRSAEPSIDELVWGTWRGLDVRAFGLSFRSPALGATVSRERFAVALTNVARELPRVVVEPHVFATRFERPPAFERVATGDDAFESSWTLWGDDRAVALAFANADLRAWVGSLGERWGIEVNGRVVTLYGPTPEQPDVVGVLEILRELVTRIGEPSTPGPPGGAGGPSTRPAAVEDAGPSA